jgi:hypothetical protein
MVNCGSKTMTIQSALLGTGEITMTMNIVAWVLGASSLPIGIVAKKIDRKIFMFTESKAWYLESEEDILGNLWNRLNCFKRRED